MVHRAPSALVRPVPPRAPDRMVSDPAFTSERSDDDLRLTLTGAWTIGASKVLEDAAKALVTDAKGMRNAIIDLSQIDSMDTAGAWLIDRSRSELEEAGTKATFEKARPEFDILLGEAHFRVFADETPPVSYTHLRAHETDSYL